MNLILLSPSDFISSNIVSLTGRRLQHALEVIKPQVDDELTIGIEGGSVGIGRVLVIDNMVLTMEISLCDEPPRKLPVVLCLALMRPIVLKRVLMTAVSMGVAEIVLFHSRQVEKSFWQSSLLRDDELRELMVLGLEQAKDTVLPRISLQKRFKPFVEDVLPGLLRGGAGIVADPSGLVLPGPFEGKLAAGDERYVLVIGPEGGFIPYEVTKFREAGCQVVGLGRRILKVETAVIVLLSKMFY